MLRTCFTLANGILGIHKSQTWYNSNVDTCKDVNVAFFRNQLTLWPSFIEYILGHLKGDGYELWIKIALIAQYVEGYDVGYIFYKYSLIKMFSNWVLGIIRAHKCISKVIIMRVGYKMTDNT